MRTILAFCLSASALFAQATPASLLADRYRIPDQKRDPWQKPAQVIAALNFSPTETVAVVEQGYPYFAPRIVSVVGKVYAINSDPLVFQGPRGALSLFTPIVASATSPNLSGVNVDTVMLVDSLRFLASPNVFLPTLAASIHSGARVVVIGPQLPSVLPIASQNTSTFVTTLFTALGFRLTQQFTFIPTEYFLVFQR